MINTHKHLKILVIVVFFLAAAIFLVSTLRRAGNNINQFTYMSYISSEYIPNYKKEFGSWPSNLDELTSVLESKLKETKADFVRERLELILNFHRYNYKGIVSSKKDERSFQYSLLLENGNVICESSLDSGYCE